MAKKASKPAKKFKSFSELHGSRSDVFKGIGGDQLGHDQQLPVNPPTPMGSPLINPGQPGHPVRPSQLGQAMGPDPSGEDFY